MSIFKDVYWRFQPNSKEKLEYFRRKKEEKIVKKYTKDLEKWLSWTVVNSRDMLIIDCLADNDFSPNNIFIDSSVFDTIKEKIDRFCNKHKDIIEEYKIVKLPRNTNLLSEIIIYLRD